MTRPASKASLVKPTPVTPAKGAASASITTPQQFDEYDHFIDRLVEAQKYKLRINSHKGFLGDIPPGRLLELLKAEIEELEEALSRGSHIEVILESGDAANFILGFVISAIRSMKA